jgi:hypothetical protein
VTLANVWLHPKTTVLGILVCIATAIPILTAQGLTLGTVGTGTVIGLAGSLTAAFLGLMARDPAPSGSTTVTTTASKPGVPSVTTRQLNGIMLIMVLLLGTMTATVPLTGCTQQQKVTIAQEIVNWTPVFVSTADTVNASIMALDPATIIVLGPVTAGINVFAPQLQQLAQTYLNNPTLTNLQLLQALITQIQQNINSAMLAAVKITNPTSQAAATRNINLLATIANTILALVQQISTKAQVAAMARNVHVTLAQVRPLLDTQAMLQASARVSNDLQLSSVVTPDQFFAYEQKAGF